MISTTSNFLQLQKIYVEQGEKDKRMMREIINEIMKTKQIDVLVDENNL
jgi:hypothetical protein